MSTPQVEKLRKASNVLLQAAETLTSKGGYEYCCLEINFIAAHSLPLRKKSRQYFNLFFPGPKDTQPEGTSCHWPEEIGSWFGTVSEPKNQEQRVLALLFAAAIAKSEGD